MRQAILIAVVFCCCEQNAEATRPLDTITIDCIFEHQNTSNITEGKITRDSSPQEPFSFTITGINESKRQAIMVGNAGSTPLLFFPNSMRWVFVEKTQTGNVMVTSMTIPSASGKTTGVHSRHAWLLDNGLISQWAGTCKVR